MDTVGRCDTSEKHTTERYFRMASYFGFLANRVYRERFPQVYLPLAMDKPMSVVEVCYAQMSEQPLRHEPSDCILSGGTGFERAGRTGHQSD